MKTSGAPVLPGLFGPAPFALPANVRETRDEAMRQVGQKAEDHRPEFADEAKAFVLRRLEAGPETAEQLTIACKNAGIVPHDDRAFGPIYFGLSRKGLIVKVGQAPRQRGHGTAGGNVWALPGCGAD